MSEIIAESVGNQYLYHGTKLDVAYRILSDNVLNGSDSRTFGGGPVGVSTSRSLDFAFNFSDNSKHLDGSESGSCYCVLVLDREKLKNHYKIIPYKDDGAFDYENIDDNNPEFLEKEEVVIGNITNVRNYIVGIYVSADVKQLNTPEKMLKYYLQFTGVDNVSDNELQQMIKTDSDVIKLLMSAKVYNTRSLYNQRNNINESVNDNYLYHGMWKDSYEYCSSQNKLFPHIFYSKNKQIGGISLTRSRNVAINHMESSIKEAREEVRDNPKSKIGRFVGNKEIGMGLGDDASYVILKFDLQKLKQNYKVVPYSYLSSGRQGDFGDEMEEVLICKDSFDFKKYLVDVEVFNRKITLDESVKSTQHLYHATYSKLWKEIQKAGYLGNSPYKMWSDSNNKFVYLATDPNVAESYAETAIDDNEKLSNMFQNDEIVILSIDTSKLDSSKLSLDSNVQDNDGSSYQYEGIIPLDAIKVYNLNETVNHKINWQNDMDAIGNVSATIGHNLFAKMPAHVFLDVTPPFDYGDDSWFDKQIQDEKPMGIPFLKVDFDFDRKVMVVIGHEGRHRVSAITRLPNGSIRDIPVAILYNHDKYPQIPSIEELRDWSFQKENRTNLVHNGWVVYYNELPMRKTHHMFENVDVESVFADYQYYDVLNMLDNNDDLWYPLIDPRSYKKALEEFTRTGQLLHTPTKYIDDWVETIARNVRILEICTDLAGHTPYMPTDDVIDYFFENREDYEAYKQKLKDQDAPLPSELFGHESTSEDISDIEVCFKLLEENGFYDRMKLPDGSDAWSDYGLKPIFDLLIPYEKGDMTPEETLVLINKCLDVIHTRGDLSSAFIKGGRETLTKISNESLENNETPIQESVFYDGEITPQFDKESMYKRGAYNIRILKNPTTREVNALLDKKPLRFVIMGKDLYVWDSLTVNHKDLCKDLGLTMDMGGRFVKGKKNFIIISDMFFSYDDSDDSFFNPANQDEMGLKDELEQGVYDNILHNVFPNGYVIIDEGGNELFGNKSYGNGKETEDAGWSGQYSKETTLESVETDRYQYNLALRIYNAILHLVQSKTINFDVDMNKIEYRITDIVEEILQKKTNKAISLVFKNKLYSSLGSSLAQFAVTMDYRFAYLLFPYLDDKYLDEFYSTKGSFGDKKKTLIDKVSDEILDNLELNKDKVIHEIIHMIDFLRYKDQSIMRRKDPEQHKNLSNDQKRDMYYNDFGELNAYYHQFINYYESNKKDEGKITFKEFVRIAATADIIPFKYMNNANREKMLKRLYAYWKSNGVKESAASNKLFSIPKDIPTNLFKITNSMKDIEKWKAKIILGNSMEEGKKVGDYEKVGYVMVSKTDNTIIPISTSDEHQQGYELMYDYYQEKYGIDPDNYIPLFLIGNVYPYEDNKEEIKKLLKKCESYGLDLEKVNIGMFYLTRYNEYITAKEFLYPKGEKKKSGDVSDLGYKLVESLKDLSDAFTEKDIRDRFIIKKIKNAINKSKDVLDSIDKELFSEDSYKRIMDLIDYYKNDLINNERLEKLFFGMNGFRNNLHNYLRDNEDSKALNKKLGSVEKVIEMIGGI